MREIHYLYKHAETNATTGYFSCEPEHSLGMGQLFEELSERPLDSFLRRYALKRLRDLREIPFPDHPALRCLQAELDALNPEFATSAPAYELAKDCQTLTPLLILRQKARPEEERIRLAAWSEIFRANIAEHRALPAPSSTGLPPLYPDLGPEVEKSVSLAEVRTAWNDGPAQAPSAASPSPEEVAERAKEALQRCGIAINGEMRHEASLSPIGLLHAWKLDYRTACGRNLHRMRGEANTYGRGMNLPQALCSCRMEMVERASAYASVEQTGGRASVMGLAGPEDRGEFIHGKRSRLLDKGLNPIDPNEFCLDLPYLDAPLYWLRGERLLQVTGGGERVFEAVLVPFQMVYLFANLDEIDLSEAPPSTGLATHSSLEAARLTALSEILERDAEATTPFHKAACFTLECGDEDPQLAALLADYHSRGINVQFQDLTGSMGFPVFQAFVVSAKGKISRGYGSGLSARKAIVSALTETPYPYPNSAPSGPPLRRLPARAHKNLPDWSTSTPASDLMLLETLLLANRLHPIYMDLTRQDLPFPVTRALIPGLAPTAEFDTASRIPPRLYQNYLRLYS